MSRSITRRVSRALTAGVAVVAGSLAIAGTASAATHTASGTVPHGGYVELPARAYDDMACEAASDDAYIGCVAYQTPSWEVHRLVYGYAFASASFGPNASLPLVIRAYNLSGTTATVSVTASS